MFFQDRENFKKYRIAAEHGDPNAQFMIAGMYILGKGTKKSYEKYQFWLACAYLNRDSRAIEMLNKLYDGRYDLLKKRFLSETCPYVIKHYPQYIPYYKK